MIEKKVVMTVIKIKFYRRDIRLMVKTQSTCMINMNMTDQNRQLLIGKNKAFVRECDPFAAIWVGLLGFIY